MTKLGQTEENYEKENHQLCHEHSYPYRHPADGIAAAQNKRGDRVIRKTYRGYVKTERTDSYQFLYL